MLRGLYTAVSAMQTTEKKIDVMANNMANVNTTGFKKDVVVSETFSEVLLHKINGELPTEAFNKSTRVEVEVKNGSYHLSTQGGFFMAKTPDGISYNRETSFAVDKDGYLRTYSRDVEGRVDASQGNYILNSNKQPIFVGSGDFEIMPTGNVVANGQIVGNMITRGGPNTIGTINGGIGILKIEANFSQGTIEATGNNLDMAIQGNGFFKIADGNGNTYYTRNGNFTLNSNGEIVTSEGYFLLNDEGASILVEGNDFQVSEKGELIINNQPVDKIDVVDIRNVSDLRKHGEGYYKVVDGATAETQSFTGGLLQGYLESSNVNTIKEMVQMISAYRTYESNQKVVKAYDELLHRAVNEIGKL
ncbi:flagellar hook-basal body protein [Alkaliphilus hydrothermalis]|uniref:Flagellar basal-body rod protein FlgG n=1 Tax=Alkaliphilus hydrothermalis TaxID=1482730 RepID=A0ABS2NQA0_9FIRM|nr:flagellar hook-basal body protein [Alkaliphilus hydrothermalis]MBM7615140.1 flagellar basal-body rod protein FlgG [Alkaliphilus hydrothermalis]